MAQLALHFVGANGFPHRVYTPLLTRMAKFGSRGSHGGNDHSAAPAAEPRAVVLGSDLHHEDYSEDWSHAVARLVGDIEGRGVAGGVIGVGHSFGGAILMCAASQRPDLFKGLVVYDPPMFSHRTRLLYTMGLALPIDIVKRFHPLIGISLRKPCVWADREEARGYLASRALFQQFHPEIFEAMLEHGLCQPGSEQGDTTTTLAFDPRTEAQIFYTVPTEVTGPHETFGQYDNTHGVPTRYFYSSEHTIASPRDIEWVGGHFPSVTTHQIDRGHFWPLLDPAGFAERIEPEVIALGEGRGAVRSKL